MGRAVGFDLFVLRFDIACSSSGDSIELDLFCLGFCLTVPPFHAGLLFRVAADIELELYPHSGADTPVG